MELFYDMLIPYMPDAIKDDEGKFISNEQKASGRRAMIELANFQNNGDVISLYHSVIYACSYAEVDLVDTILSIPEDVKIPNGMTLGEMTTNAAKMLFASIKPGNTFDINMYCAYLLTAAHILVSRKPEPASEPEEIADDVSVKSDDA